MWAAVLVLATVLMRGALFVRVAGWGVAWALAFDMVPRWDTALLWAAVLARTSDDTVPQWDTA